MEPDPIEKAVTLHGEAQELEEQGHYPEAFRSATQAAKLFEEHDGPDSADLANVLLDLASICQTLGDLLYALSHAHRAATILDKLGEALAGPERRPASSPRPHAAGFHPPGAGSLPGSRTPATPRGGTC